eukprot:TRINITY_DN629_c0_g3_i1.p1 TRINITY_DN629_c0_g3~~TRINITY_DN629_c0_g3_i1.p1  ORF type:complete len:519 (+),score=175.78 TRINITY_DN629_c0_g3_i1:122-1678(+)
MEEGYLQEGNQGNQRRVYPRERNGRKNEWKAVVTHLEEMNSVLTKAERDIKDARSQELQLSYDEKQRLNQESVQRQLEAKARDHEEMILKKRQFDIDQQIAREEKQKLNQNLANNYTSMSENKYLQQQYLKQNDIQEGVRMIEDAQRCLEAERRAKKEKLDNFNREAKHVVEEKEYRKLSEKERSMLDKEEHRELMNQYSQKELQREANYRNFFHQVEQSQQALQQMHNEKVLAQVNDRIRSLEEMVSRNEQQYNRKKAEEELAKMRRHKDELLNTAGTIKNQMANKEQQREEERVDRQRRVEESLKLSQEYMDYQTYAKLEKQDQHRMYKDYLDKQKQDKDEKAVKTNAMARTDKLLNKEVLHAFKDGKSEVTALIPGYSNSKYIHPYSPEARYAQILQHKKQGATITNGQDNQRTIFQPEPVNQPIDIGSSSQRAMVRQSSDAGFQQNSNYRNAGPASTIVSPTASPISPSIYNPITNPIPGYNQNPYINREFRKSQGSLGNRSVLAQAANNNIIS